MVALVINVNSYNFTDFQGKQVEGSSVEMVANVEGRLRVIKHTSKDIGYMGRIFPVYPGIYEIDFNVIPAGGTKFRTEISNATLIEEFPIDLNF